jgi:hypothetical protein
VDADLGKGQGFFGNEEGRHAMCALNFEFSKRLNS